MAEKSAGNSPQKLSLMVRVDSGIIEHNNRVFVAKNVDESRIADNIIYKQEDIRDKYHELFDEALDEYNSRKRSNEKIADYYEHICNGKKEKPFYEAVVYIGNKDTCGLNSDNWNKAVEMLDEYMRTFEQRNPNIKTFNCTLHCDEMTPHLHIDFVPICKSPNRGLPVRVSLKKALEQQGIVAVSKSKSEWAVWKDVEVAHLAEILKKHGFEQDIVGANYAHKTVDEFKAYQDEIKRLRDEVAELKKKNTDELTTEDIQLIRNENDLMKSEIEKRDELIRALFVRKNAKFERFEIFSKEKLLYIMRELENMKIQFVEDSNALYIPDYALPTCKKLAANFKPTKPDNVRNKLRLDIDTLIYSSENLENLLKKLQEQGCEFKRGEYLAVKPTYAQRFIRLKSLGEEYLPHNLEKRIADRDIFEKAVPKRAANTAKIEQMFYTEIANVVASVRTLVYRPRKVRAAEIYTFENDNVINDLSKQLTTMNEFNINSREKLYATAVELENKIEDNKKRAGELTSEIPTLKSDIEHLKFYFANKNNSRLDAMEPVKFAAAREVAEKYNVKTVADIAELQNRLDLLPNYINNLKAEIIAEQLKLSRVGDVIKTYERIVEGNFIDELVRAQREQEKDKAAQNAEQIKEQPKKSSDNPLLRRNE